MSRGAETIGVSRSQLHARTTGRSKPRDRDRKAGDDDLRLALRHPVDARPSYGYRRRTALLNRERRQAGLEPINRKRVLRILNPHGLTREQSTGRREGRVRAEANDLLERLGYRIELEPGRDVYDILPEDPVSAHDALRMLQKLRDACRPPGADD